MLFGEYLFPNHVCERLSCHLMEAGSLTVWMTIKMKNLPIARERLTISL